MKILLEKPTPSIPQQTNNAAASNQDLLEMLSACFFTDAMNEATTDDKTPVTTKEDFEKTEVNTDDSTAPVMTNINTMQKMIEDMLAHASTYQAQQATPSSEQQAGKVTITEQASITEKYNAAFMNEQSAKTPEEQPTNNHDVAQHNLIVKNKYDQPSEQYHPDQKQEADSHQQDVKLTETQIKLTPSITSSSQSEINQTMNVLAANAGNESQSIQLETDGKALKKTLENWTNSINTPRASEQIIATPTQASDLPHEFSGMLMARQNDPLAGKAETTPLTMQLDHIEPSPTQPGIFHVKIKVNPPELGPIHASIKMNNNAVEIQIMTNNTHAEQVVKAHLSALTAQFSESSMQLNTVVVLQQSPSSTGQDQQSSQQAPEYLDEQGLSPNVTDAQPDDKKTRKSNKLVDAYI